MKVVNYEQPKSSFLSIEKDLDIIINKFFQNTRLQRLLYYNRPDALSMPDLTTDQWFEVISKNIKIIPKLSVNGEVLSYIIISFDNFTPNSTNPEFRDNIISFDIICHYDQWQLKDSFQLRPYRIAAEIDSMFNDKRLTGIGTLQLIGANQLILNEEFAGITLMYSAIHGEEDKKGFLNPQEEKEFVEEFLKMRD